MAYVVAAVVVFGLIALLNLLLTFGVIRRLREHTATLELLESGTELEIRAKPGEPVLDFTAVATTGETVSRVDLMPDTVVAMLSATCPPCHDVADKFVPYAAQLPRERVLAVVYGTEEETAELRARLEPVARVVVEEQVDGAVTKAFRNKIYPSTFVVDGDRKVSASGFDVDAIRLTVPVLRLPAAV
ncbi:redoxin domain-containing protein [Catellatospora sp. KI3]|uniref:TlpA family protein disulfide reductase n=1 Tax=Catellatospora sp. KI3 TaxID=3041620 RepID=UPI002482EF25|nr:redoxin domain-containing protein [Catellatospora sp. KI3]MDI1461425.1 redoxin domain-containing protein [Catellatospora sp. KI3]